VERRLVADRPGDGGGPAVGVAADGQAVEPGRPEGVEDALTRIS
jgi:hypothetical protein